VLQQLLRRSATAMSAAVAAERWCGLRPLLVDGSSTFAPDTEDSQEVFGHPTGQKPGCGFPVPKIFGHFFVATGLILELLAFPLHTHEQSKVWLLHPLLGPGDLLVADRGFCSFAHLTMLAAAGVMGLFRMHQKQIVDFRPYRKTRRDWETKGPSQRKKEQDKWKKKYAPARRPTSRFVRRLAKHDQIVEWVKPVRRPQWMTVEQYASLPPLLRVRELRYWLPRKGQRTLCVTIATTLLDPVRYPKGKITELYEVHWTVETTFEELRSHLGLETTRDWCRNTVLRGAPCLFGLYTVVALLYGQLPESKRSGQVTWPGNAGISFSDALAAIRRWLWAEWFFDRSPEANSSQNYRQPFSIRYLLPWHRLHKPHYSISGIVTLSAGALHGTSAIMKGDAAPVLGPAPGLVLAINQYQLGEKDKAQKTFEKALKAFDWFDWQSVKADHREAWICHTLRLEAETLLKRRRE
jgi:hypothetical protein